jgi:hypothetical protein
MSDLRHGVRPGPSELAIPANPVGAILLRRFGEPLSGTLRIPCYRGWGSVRLTYRELIRQIRGALRVAKSQVPLPVVRRLPSEPPARYQYLLLRGSRVSLEGFGALFQPLTVARWNA